MIKWKSQHFKDLKPFDKFSFDSLLERTDKTFRLLDEKDYLHQLESGRAFIGIQSSNLDETEVAYYHKKYNHPNVKIPTDSQIVLRQFKPPFDKPEYHEEANLYLFDSLTSNVNNRDGFIVGGLSTKYVEAIHINPVKEKRYTGDWMYFEFPYKYVYDNMLKSINNAPLFTAKKFVEEVEKRNLWKDKEAVSQLVDDYTKKRPNWHHDFPVASFLQVHNEGIIFPCQWFKPTTIASEGTHKMVMCGFNKMDIPFILPVPYFTNFTKYWYVQTRKPIFYNFKYNRYDYIFGIIDLEKKQIEWEFTQAEKQAVQMNKKQLEKMVK